MHGIAAWRSARHARTASVMPDPYDLHRLTEIWGLEPRRALWTPQYPGLVGDVWSAARYCIDLLRARPQLRKRFPHALSAGASGGFARFLTRDSIFGPRLSPRSRRAIALAFRSDLGGGVRHAFTVREDLRANFPLGLTPAGWPEFIGWLFRHGAKEHGLRPEAIWWFAIESMENTAAELVRTYRFMPEWQRAVPDGLTVFGRDELAAWLRATYGLEASWLDPAAWKAELTPAQQIRLAYARREFWQREHDRPFESTAQAERFLRWLATPQADVPTAAQAWCAGLDLSSTARELAEGGVNVIGHFCYPSGLRTSVEAMVEGFRRVGTAMELRDITVDRDGDEPHHAAYGGFECYDATILHVQPEPLFDKAYVKAGLSERRPRTHRIGYWYWELESVPDLWLRQQAEVDELWTASGFVAEALKARFRVPVFAIPPGIELPPFTPRPRSRFGLSDSTFVFLFVFHMMSSMERKNPLGLIRAFRRAFGSDPSVALVLKTSFGDRHKTLVQEMRGAAEGGGIRIIDAVFTREDTLALMEACDCYVSLHRSEGFGLTMAEAMLLGKPVIATNYSGNTDFMHPGNSLLVDFDLVRLDRDALPYKAGSRWAEPSVEHAARLMREVVQDRARARDLGAAARTELRRTLSLEAAGRRMAERLAQIRAEAVSEKAARP